MVSVSRMTGGSDPHNELAKNAGTPAISVAQTPTTKKVSAFKRLGKLTGSKKDPMYPLKDLEDSEKITSAPPKVSGTVILKRDKKRRMNLQKRYHAKLNNGVLKLYKQKDKQKEDKRPFTAEFNIDLSTISQVLYNDDVRKLSLVFQKDTYTLVPIEKDKYLQWKTGIHQHRLYRQFQKREGLLDESENSQLQNTQLAFQNINVEDGLPGKVENKIAITQDQGALPTGIDEKLRSPKHSKEGEKDEKKGKENKEMKTNENNNPPIGTNSPKKIGSNEGDKEEKKLVTALKALTTAMETYKLVHSSSIKILDRIQKCHDESTEILKELKKLKRKKHDGDECCSDEDEEDSTSAKEPTKEVPVTAPTVDQNAMAMLKASVSALNINEEEPQVAKVKKSPSLPNIAVSNAKNQSETRIRPSEPHVVLPTQSPAPSAIPAQTQTTTKADATKTQVHPALVPPKKRREALPHDQIYGDSISMMAILKRSLPIHAYEPLGILQSACEELRFAATFLDRLQKIDNPGDRMSLIAGFIISGYSGMSIRNRKPFNPLLGETFDYVSDDGWKYHAEQVSHHPPISACNAEGNGWEWQQTLQGTITPSLDGSTSLNCVLPIRLTLANGEEYMWHKVTTIIQNARAEATKRRVKNEGEMIIRCSNGYECKMVFATEKNGVRGEIKNNQQALIFRLVGCWDKGLNRILPSNEQERLFEAPPPYELSSRYYGFNKFTLSLNEITSELRQFLPMTDSRLRPDQRFLEFGDSKRANDAKNSLEQAQRQRSHLQHRQMWFTERPDPFSQKNLWMSNKKYWTSKQNCFKDPYSAKIVPLFSGE